MTRNIEDMFSQWAKPPSRPEEQRCENAIRAIRNAIDKSEKLTCRSLLVFPQGSYRNRVNVRQDSDVDVGILCDDVFIYDCPQGITGETLGICPASYGYRQFKDEVEEALVVHFGDQAVNRGNKAINIRETSYHVDADVVPFFEYRNYSRDGRYFCGVALQPDAGGEIYNYPECLNERWPHMRLHYENGVFKNKNTDRSYKGVVRILKKIRHEMENAGIDAAKKVPGFLIECMAWNVPDEQFCPYTWRDKVRSVLHHLLSTTSNDVTCSDWREVNGIKFLFHSTQSWTRQEAYAFVVAAWAFVEEWSGET